MGLRLKMPALKFYYTKHAILTNAAINSNPKVTARTQKLILPALRVSFG
jgi:hypothetical protein